MFGIAPVATKINKEKFLLALELLELDLGAVYKSNPILFKFFFYNYDNHQLINLRLRGFQHNHFIVCIREYGNTYICMFVCMYAGLCVYMYVCRCVDNIILVHDYRQPC